MQVSRTDLADIGYFLAIARHLSFRRAALDLGVSVSALSHAMKGFEARLGVRLLNRTSRSVTLTAAGEQLRNAVLGPMEAIGDAFEGLDTLRDAPRGRVRLNVMNDAAPLLLTPVLPEFVARYPQVALDITATNRMVDIVDGGFDAGIRYGGTIPEDMVAQRLSAPLRWVVVGAPEYLARAGVPTHPRDLLEHACIRLRTGGDQIYRWELDRGDESLALDVPGPLTVDHSDITIAMALDGVGLAYVLEPMVAPLLRAGRLRIVLEDWASMGEPFHMYYSSARNVPQGLRLLIDLIREKRPLGF